MKKNLILRTVSGIIFIAVMVLGINTHAIAFTSLQCFVIIVSMFEIQRLLWGDLSYIAQRILGVAAGLICVAVIAGHMPFAAFIVPLLAMMVVQLYRKDPEPFTIIGQNILSVAYIAFPVALWSVFVYNEMDDFDGRELLGCFIILWSCDVGAYIFGLLFGRHGKHKLFPRLSPKKTWEGLAGGLICALIASYLVYLYIFPGKYHLIHCFTIAGIITAFGVWGDLVESQLKRSVNAKDSGQIIPGHGGFLDRFDASLLAIPAVYLYLKIVGIM